MGPEGESPTGSKPRPKAERSSSWPGIPPTAEGHPGSAPAHEGAARSTEPPMAGPCGWVSPTSGWIPGF
eukprot:12584061-Alexandrium_andersonii.AAC.1